MTTSRLSRALRQDKLRSSGSDPASLEAMVSQQPCSHWWKTPLARTSPPKVEAASITPT